MLGKLSGLITSRRDSSSTTDKVSPEPKVGIEHVRAMITVDSFANNSSRTEKRDVVTRQKISRYVPDLSMLGFERISSGMSGMNSQCSSVASYIGKSVTSSSQSSRHFFSRSGTRGVVHPEQQFSSPSFQHSSGEQSGLARIYFGSSIKSSSSTRKDFHSRAGSWINPFRNSRSSGSQDRSNRDGGIFQVKDSNGSSSGGGGKAVQGIVEEKVDRTIQGLEEGLWSEFMGENMAASAVLRVPTIMKNSCVICNQSIVSSKKAHIELPCGHASHFKCMQQEWWRDKGRQGRIIPNCPTCRQPVPPSQTVDSYKKLIDEGANIGPKSSAQARPVENASAASVPTVQSVTSLQTVTVTMSGRRRRSGSVSPSDVGTGGVGNGGGGLGGGGVARSALSGDNHPVAKDTFLEGALIF